MSRDVVRSSHVIADRVVGESDANRISQACLPPKDSFVDCANVRRHRNEISTVRNG